MVSHHTRKNVLQRMLHNYTYALMMVMNKGLVKRKSAIMLADNKYYSKYVVMQFRCSFLL